jgi:hypothetical protein
MSRTRLLAAHVVIAVIIGGSLHDIVMQTEHWPFSNYPMFSEIHRTSVLRWPRLYGLTPDGREVPVVSHAELWPLDQSRLPIGLRTIYSDPKAGDRVPTALKDVLRRYEARRSTGEHTGPPLVALRLYLVSWPVEPFAHNLDTPSDRRLLAVATLER